MGGGLGKWASVPPLNPLPRSNFLLTLSPFWGGLAKGTLLTRSPPYLTPITGLFPSRTAPPMALCLSCWRSVRQALCGPPPGRVGSDAPKAKRGARHAPPPFTEKEWKQLTKDIAKRRQQGANAAPTGPVGRAGILKDSDW